MASENLARLDGRRGGFGHIVKEREIARMGVKFLSGLITALQAFSPSHAYGPSLIFAFHLTNLVPCNEFVYPSKWLQPTGVHGHINCCRALRERLYKEGKLTASSAKVKTMF